MAVRRLDGVRLLPRQRRDAANVGSRMMKLCPHCHDRSVGWCRYCGKEYCMNAGACPCNLEPDWSKI